MNDDERYLNSLKLKLTQAEKEEVLNILAERKRHHRAIVALDAKYIAFHNSHVQLLCLPPEVVNLIFESAIVDSSEHKNHGSFGRLASAIPRIEVTVSHVCGKWRAIALANPRLWTRVSSDGLGNPRALSSRLEHYLARLRTRPVDLYFSPPNIKDNLGLMQVVSSINAAVPYTSRCRMLSITFPSHCKFGVDSVASSLLREASANHLESFQIVQHNGPDPQSYTVVFNEAPGVFRAGAPRLTFCRIVAVNPFLTLPPLSVLTSLKIGCSLDDDAICVPDQYIIMILRLPCLSILSLSNIDCDLGHRSVLQSITLNKLAHLRLHQCAELALALPSLIAPNLRTLFLQPYSHLRGSQTPESRFPSLKTLFITSDTALTYHKLSTLTYLTQTITCLVVSHESTAGSRSPVLPSLTDKPSGVDVWPSLKRVIAKPTSVGNDPSDSQLLEFVQALPQNDLTFELSRSMLGRVRSSSIDWHDHLQKSKFATLNDDDWRAAVAFWEEVDADDGVLGFGPPLEGQILQDIADPMTQSDFFLLRSL